MGSYLQQVFNTQKWFLVNRLLSPIVFLSLTLFYKDNNFFRFFFINETLIVFTTLLFVSFIRNINKRILYSFLVLSVLTIVSSFFFSNKLLLLALAFSEMINFLIALGCKRELYLKHFSSYLLAYLSVILISVLNDYSFETVFIFNISLLWINNLTVLRHYTPRSKKMNYRITSVALLRNLFNVMARAEILNKNSNIFSFLFLKFVNQLTLFFWSYIKSNNKINIVNQKLVENRQLPKALFLIAISLMATFIISDKLKFELFALIILTLVFIEIIYAKKHTHN